MPEKKSSRLRDRALDVLQPPDLDERGDLDPGTETARWRQSDGGAFHDDTEEVRQDQTEDEDWHRYAEVGEDHRPDVGRRVAFPARATPAGYQRSWRRTWPERSVRRWSGVVRMSRSATSRDSLSEFRGRPRAPVPGRCRTAPEWLVEPVPGRVRAAGGLRRALPQGRTTWVARREPGQREHEEHDPEQDRDRRTEPTDDETDHRRRIVSLADRPRW